MGVDSPPEQVKEYASDQLVPDGTITHLEAAKLLLDEWKFRHQHLWDSLRRYGLAAVIVSIVPYLKTDLVAQLREIVLVFPVVGWLLSLAAIWLFGAEYHRLRPVAEKHRKLLDYPKRDELHGWKRILGKKIGWSTVWILFLGFTILSLLNAILLCELVRKTAG